MVLVKVQLFGLRPLLKSSNNTTSGEGVVGGESGTGNGEVGSNSRAGWRWGNAGLMVA